MNGGEDSYAETPLQLASAAGRYPQALPALPCSVTQVGGPVLDIWPHTQTPAGALKPSFQAVWGAPGHIHQCFC